MQTLKLTPGGPVHSGGGAAASRRGAAQGDGWRECQVWLFCAIPTATLLHGRTEAAGTLLQGPVVSVVPVGPVVRCKELGPTAPDFGPTFPTVGRDAVRARPVVASNWFGSPRVPDGHFPCTMPHEATTRPAGLAWPGLRVSPFHRSSCTCRMGRTNG